MERDNSVNGLIPDLDKLSLEKGRPLDVEDLDDQGWLAASEQKKIVELGSLGEGAGGAVTRCKLKDGKTVFALKVRFTRYTIASRANEMLSRSLPPIPTPTSRSRLFANSISIRIAHRNTFAATTVHSWISRLEQYQLRWNFAKEAVWTVYTKKSRSSADGQGRRCLEKSQKAS